MSQCDKCGTDMDATGTTEEYPNCNTWTCPNCGYVRPEAGSARLADADERAIWRAIQLLQSKAVKEEF